MNFREYNTEDSDQVIELLNKCLKRNSTHKITKESFEWKHFDKFFEGKTTAFLAEEKGQVVSFVCFTPLTLNNQSIFWNCCIQATDINYRRKGLVTTLTKLCEHKIQKITNTSQNNFVGFSNEDGIKIDQNSKSINHKILGQFNQIILLPNPANIISKLIFISNENQFCNEVNDVAKNYLTWLKNEAYINWKYKYNPKLTFVKLRLDECEIYLKQSKFSVEIYDIINTANSNTNDNVLIIINFVQKQFPTSIITITVLDNQVTNSIFDQKRLFGITKKIPIYLTVSFTNPVFLDINNWLLFGGDII